MSNKLSFKNAASVANNTNKVLRLEYGKHNSLTILGIESTVPDTGSPYLSIKFGAENADHTEKFYLSEKALPYTMRNLEALAKTVGAVLPEEFSVEELNAALVGKKLALVLNGEEYESTRPETAGQVRVKAVLGRYPFCAPEGHIEMLTSPILKKLQTQQPGNSPEADGNQVTDNLPF